ncbi:MAG TPA: ATP-binding cassette domain-containing protein [Gemmatimonadales bacterium]|nr:ATP-binding cassette domain-containing protein [Gemmatimonadales bacterium]
MTDAGAILRIDHLTRVVHDVRVVDDVSLEVARGDILAVVGPSGAGKSSFLRLLNRLDEPTSGTVYLNGRDYTAIPPRELRHQIGMVMQSAYLFPGTIAQNISYGPAQRGIELSSARIDSLLRDVGLAGRGTGDVALLSGGEAQRVALARALANEPQLLLLDEPTSALDETARKEIEVLIGTILREHRLACVIVTHDRAQARRIATRVMVMERGRLTALGSVEEVLDAR